MSWGRVTDYEVYEDTQERRPRPLPHLNRLKVRRTLGGFDDNLCVSASPTSVISRLTRIANVHERTYPCHAAALDHVDATVGAVFLKRFRNLAARACTYPLAKFGAIWFSRARETERDMRAPAD
jgi:hypothetical protein